MSSNQIHTDVVVVMSTNSNACSKENANTAIVKKRDEEEYPCTSTTTHPSRNSDSTATVTAVNENSIYKMMPSSFHRENWQCTKEDFLYNSDIISLSGDNDGKMVTPPNCNSSTSGCNNTSTSPFSPSHSTADLEKTIPTNIVFDNGHDIEVAVSTPATPATGKRREIIFHSSLFFSPLQRLETNSSKKNRTSNSKSKKRSSSLLAIRYGDATSASKNKRNKKRKTTPNSQEKYNKTNHPQDDVLEQITDKKHRDSSSKNKKQSANSSTRCTSVPRKIQIPTNAKKYGTRFSIETYQHFQITPFREADRGWKRMNLEIGFHGISCAHCDGRNGKKRGGRCGRYFPSSLKTLADPKKMLFTMYRHLQRCEDVTPQEKDRLDDLYETHDAERLAQIRGTQKKFYEFIWKELRKGNELTHSNTADKDNTSDDCD